MNLADQAKKAGMSDEEIEILKSGEAALAGTAEDVEAAAPEPAENEAPAPAAQAAPETQAVEATVATEQPAIQAMDVPALPENFETRLAEIKSEIRAATKKAFDGEMTPEEYADLQEKLSDERERLLDAKKDADYAQKYNAQRQSDFVADTRAAAEKAYKADGVDYADPGNKAKFDRAVSLLASDPEYAGKPITELRSVYDEAHKLVRAMLGLKDKPAPVAATPATPRQVPTTLSALPNAAQSTVQDETFQKMQTLDGEDLERFYASLPKAEVSRLMKLAS